MGTIWFANEMGAGDAPAPQGEDADPEAPELYPLAVPALLPLDVPDVEGAPAMAPLVTPEPTTVLVPELAPPPDS